MSRGSGSRVAVEVKVTVCVVEVNAQCVREAGEINQGEGQEMAHQ